MKKPIIICDVAIPYSAAVAALDSQVKRCLQKKHYSENIRLRWEINGIYCENQMCKAERELVNGRSDRYRGKKKKE